MEGVTNIHAEAYTYGWAITPVSWLLVVDDYHDDDNEIVMVMMMRCSSYERSLSVGGWCGQWRIYP